MTEFFTSTFLLFLARAPIGLEDLLAQANRLRCDLDQFVVVDELDGLLEPHTRGTSRMASSAVERACWSVSSLSSTLTTEID